MFKLLVPHHNFIKNRFIILLLLWQLVSVYLMAVGAWSVWVAWVNVGLILLFIIVRPAFDGLLLVVGSIAFYIVLPSHFSDTLSTWRPVVGVLFLKAMLEWWSYSSPREGRLGGVVEAWENRVSITMTSPSPSSWRRGVDAARSVLSLAYNFLLAYEKIGIALFVLGALSLALAQYPLRGASQLIFLLNTALLYPVVVWVVKSREQFIRLLKYGALSTGTIIAIGYVQFGATLFSVAYYFWQYWALRVASLYYGLPLAKVLQYSNSWVTVDGEAKTLRMFSIMTSSHAFAMICVFFLAFALPLLYVKAKRSGPSAQQPGIASSTPPLEEGQGEVVEKSGDSQTSLRPPLTPPQAGENKTNAWLRAGIVLACLALIISGTRGVWAGMVPVLGVVIIAYYWKRLRLRQCVAPLFAAMLVVVILFEVSPLLDRSFAWVRNGGWRSGTYSRIISIVDTGETSNAGRLDMWKAASKYALQHPLGVGYANFVVTLVQGSTTTSFDDAAKQDNDLYNLPQRYVTAHSLYLQLLVELSIVGLGLFGLLWLLYFKKAWEYIKAQNAAVTPETIYIASITLVFLWFLAYGIFDVTWLNDKILLYTFLALALARVAFNEHTVGSDTGEKMSNS